MKLSVYEVKTRWYYHINCISHITDSIITITRIPKPSDINVTNFLHKSVIINCNLQSILII